MARRALARLETLLLPGVVVHELAHAVTVILLPNVSLVEVDLTSHVRHRGQYTITRSFLISYAPLAVNTSVALGSTYALTRLSPLESFQTAMLSILLAYLAIVSGLTAFPSYQDAISPLSMLRRQLFTRRIVVVLPALPLILLACLPGVGFTWVCRRSPLLRLCLAGAYTIGILLLGAGIIDLPTDPATYAEFLEQL